LNSSRGRAGVPQTLVPLRMTFPGKIPACPRPLPALRFERTPQRSVGHQGPRSPQFLRCPRCPSGQRSLGGALPRVYLAHILECIEHIERYTKSSFQLQILAFSSAGKRTRSTVSPDGSAVRRRPRPRTRRPVLEVCGSSPIDNKNPRTFYNGVGFVKRHFHPCGLGAGRGAPQALIADP
jgi:hypothetical protein